MVLVAEIVVAEVAMEAVAAVAVVEVAMVVVVVSSRNFLDHSQQRLGTSQLYVLH